MGRKRGRPALPIRAIDEGFKDRPSGHSDQESQSQRSADEKICDPGVGEIQEPAETEKQDYSTEQAKVGRDMRQR